MIGSTHDESDDSNISGVCALVGDIDQLSDNLENAQDTGAVCEFDSGVIAGDVLELSHEGIPTKNYVETQNSTPNVDEPSRDIALLLNQVSEKQDTDVGCITNTDSDVPDTSKRHKVVLVEVHLINDQN